MVEKDCSSLIVELEAEQPTLIIEARNARGDETLEGHVSVDGVSVEERPDGGAVPVDPGQHSLRLDVPGHPPVERSVVVRPGEKDRRVVLQVEPAATVALPAPADVRPASAPPPSVVYVLGGVSVLAFGSYGYFALAGKHLETDRARQCSPACSDVQVAPIRLDYTLADVSLGVGTLAVGTALWLLLTPRRSHAVSMGFFAGPVRRGGSASLEVGF